jgi:hypothetical protein
MADREITVNWKKIFRLGCLSGSVLMILTCFAILIAIYKQKIPYVQNYFPTPTATPPHILLPQPASDVKVTNDDFSDNLGDWSVFYSLSKAEVKDGKLFLESFEDGGFAIGYCDFCSFVLSTNHSLRTPYYLQADFNTDKEVNEYYGLVFNVIREKHSYYIFAVNPIEKIYNLDKFQDDKWTNISSETDESNVIRPYPETNTLSVDFEGKAITLYANGKMLISLTDENPTDMGKIGVFIGNRGFKLIVDNVFAYHRK